MNVGDPKYKKPIARGKGTERQLEEKRILARAAARRKRLADLRNPGPKPKKKSKLTEIVKGKKTYLYKQKQLEAKLAVRKPGRFASAEKRPGKRTSDIIKQLEKAGLTKNEIYRLQGLKPRQLPQPLNKKPKPRQLPSKD